MSNRRCPTAAVIVAALSAFTIAGCSGANVAPQPASIPTTTTSDAAASTTSAASSSTISAGTSTVGDAETSPEQLTVQIIAQTARDPDVFTQGLEVAGGVLYESSGLYGKSFVQTVDRDSGNVVARTAFAHDVFAEGLTLSDGRLIVLSWQEQTAFVLDPQTLAETSRFIYEGEGWGLCDLGDRLVMSDGGGTLRLRDRQTFEAIGEVPVRLDGALVDQLNELECVDGNVYANIFNSDTILRIDSNSGDVTAVIDASSLRPESTKADANAVLNGIGYIAETDSFLLGGKRWPMLYEVRFVS